MFRDRDPPSVTSIGAFPNAKQSEKGGSGLRKIEKGGSALRKMEQSQESFYKPVGLIKEPHYEDDTTDVTLKESIPRLRKQVLIKDAEIKRNKIEAENARI